jgi:hypothetical protein
MYVDGGDQFFSVAMVRHQSATQNAGHAHKHLPHARNAQSEEMSNDKTSDGPDHHNHRHHHHRNLPLFCFPAAVNRPAKSNNDDLEFTERIPGPDLAEEEYILSVLTVQSRYLENIDSYP